MTQSDKKVSGSKSDVESRIWLTMTKLESLGSLLEATDKIPADLIRLSGLGLILRVEAEQLGEVLEELGRR